MTGTTLMEPSRHGSAVLDAPSAPDARAFHRLLAWLDAGEESCGERYLEMRRRLVSYFDRRNRIFADELTDETFNRIGRILERDGTIDVTPPARYCYVVAKYVLLEDLRRERRQNAHRASELAEGSQRWRDDSSAAGGEPDGDERLEGLKACLRELGTEQRTLIVEYYQDDGERKIARRRRLAQRLGVSSNALAIRVSRIRRKLEARIAAFGLE